MAVAIPLVMAATGASAAIGAALGIGATMVTLGAGVLVAATGVGSKVNKAASKVFGEDVVKFANIAGAAYMALGMPGMPQGGASLAGNTPATSTDPSLATLPPTDPAEFAQMDAGGGILSQTAQQGVAAVPKLGTAQGAPAYSGPAVTAGSPGAAKGGLVDKIGDFWSKSGDHTRAAIVQVGGGVLAGAAQGYAQGQQLEDQRKEAERLRLINNTGSGLVVRGDYQFGPGRVPRA